MSNLIPFTFEGTNVRIFKENGKAFFCGKDVATALGYTNTNKALSDHCKTDGVTKRYPIVDSLGRTQQARFISEGDVLRLIVASKLPTAQKFEAWVFDEVLPTLFNQGSYQLPALSPIANPVIAQAKEELVLCQAARGLIQADHLEARARVILARGLGEFPQLEPATRPLYAQDFLKEKGLSKDQMKRISPTFGKRVKATYTLEHGREPEKYPLNLGNGQTRQVNAYTEKDRPLFEGVWSKYYAN
ncbi:Bro-N domain-containing protein [Winkia sp. UMB3158]|uniref:Bro-N domain-containing protein n=12 Tax=Bacillati TaxID=1783272 RepID=A0AAW6XXP9_STRAG|nr:MULTISPECIES: Bro-N domain-containing protein [Terrabacteria group]MDK8341251.1 Bro-N domain-containing protein [Winkia sp. UMB3164B]OFT55576.1 hypothetical protein HMPREF3152_04730 [Actinomyces sp. HMSC06A08]MDK6240205.1 Bro-N domain-containing protein [Winkia sp. UMB10116]MDK6900344.1 Bro-N domain-containing protein [Streptococcus agalactiae]MDK7148560.1 Bro-N domain-containing protein [Winkia sp. UMB3158]